MRAAALLEGPRRQTRPRGSRAVATPRFPRYAQAFEDFFHWAVAYDENFIPGNCH